MRDKKPHHGDADRLTRKKKEHDTLDLGIRLHSTNSGIFLQEKRAEEAKPEGFDGCRKLPAQACYAYGERTFPGNTGQRKGYRQERWNGRQHKEDR